MNPFFRLVQVQRLAIDSGADGPGSAGASVLNLISGSFTYISGRITDANPESVMIVTPVATVGVHGTVVAGHIGPEIGSGDASYTITVLDGTIRILDLDGRPIAFLDQPLQTVALVPSADQVLSAVITTRSLTDVIETAYDAFQVLGEPDFVRIADSIAQTATSTLTDAVTGFNWPVPGPAPGPLPGTQVADLPPDENSNVQLAQAPAQAEGGTETDGADGDDDQEPAEDEDNPDGGDDGDSGERSSDRVDTVRTLFDGNALIEPEPDAGISRTRRQSCYAAGPGGDRQCD